MGCQQCKVRGTTSIHGQKSSVSTVVTDTTRASTSMSLTSSLSLKVTSSTRGADASYAALNILKSRSDTQGNPTLLDAQCTVDKSFSLEEAPVVRLHGMAEHQLSTRVREHSLKASIRSSSPASNYSYPFVVDTSTDDL